MARKKANNSIDPIQKECELEAIEFVANWFEWQNFRVDQNDIFVVWFAFTKRGYRCMISTKFRPNLFFELSVNKRSGDIQCDCYERFEHVVMNGSKFDVIKFTDRQLRITH